MVVLVIVGSVYSSLWIPQIYRSAVRGSRPGLSMEYIIGGTLGRLFFALCQYLCQIYSCCPKFHSSDIFGCPENVLGVQTSRTIFFLFVKTGFFKLVQVGLILASCHCSFKSLLFLVKKHLDRPFSFRKGLVVSALVF